MKLSKPQAAKSLFLALCLGVLTGCDYIEAKNNYDELVEILGESGLNGKTPEKLEQELSALTAMRSENAELVRENEKLRAELSRRKERIESMF